MIGYRHADPRFPFLWETSAQPAARWHADGDGPVQYLATTPDAAWAELLRHEEITDPADLATVRRALWAIELPDTPLPAPRLPARTVRGGPASYAACQRAAADLCRAGAPGLRAPSAAVRPSSASGFRVDGGMRRGPVVAEEMIVLFGPRPDVVGWAACSVGRPREDLLARVRVLGPTTPGRP